MAISIPETLEGYSPTTGEKRVLKVLKHLPDDCLIWYEVVLSERNRKPDFMILDPNRGVIVIEVKDWGKDSILKASPREFRIKTSGASSRRQNPDHKCQIYVADAKELLSLSPELVDQKNRLVVPIEYLVIFPNMSAQDFDEIGLESVISREHVVFAEDLRRTPDVIGRIQALMPLLPQRINSHQISAIRLQLREEVTIANPTGDSGFIKDTTEVVFTNELGPDVFAIDQRQEEIAKSLGEGPRLMRGVAGSGKTLIMLMRAKLIAANAEHTGNPQRVLIVCWNISLANYMRQAFDHINIPLSSQSVEIVHFMEWARSLILKYNGKGVFPRPDDPDFEGQVTTLLQYVKLKEQDKYDAVYIDEAQDFQEEWIHFLFHQAAKGNEPSERNFIVAADDAQRIYKRRGFSWDSLGIPMQGRSQILRKIYRNSIRVWAFAGWLLGNISSYYDDIAKIEFAPKPSHDPQLIECQSLEKQVKQAVKTVQLVASQGYSLRNVLILYRRKTIGGYPLVDRLVAELQAANLPYEWIADFHAKSNFQWSQESVKISTVHSAKGLDAPVVIVLGAEAFDEEDKESDEIKLMYVALTRAREYLIILYSGSQGIVPHLLVCRDKYEKHRENLLKLEAHTLSAQVN